MTRPRKQTVDFFPHMVKHGKTIFILEQKHGNDGYAAWFKILEMLGDSEGHVIDCRNPVTWEYLQAITRLHEDILQDILNLLAKLEAIDPELWQSRVIWSENFLQNVAEVYRNRKVPLPQKPHIYTSIPASGGITTPQNPAEPPPEGITTSENPQSRVEESRGEERRKKLSCATPPPLKPEIDPKATSTERPPKAAERVLDTRPNGQDFDRFWASYPRKVGKPKARKAWDRLIKSRDFPGVEAVLAAIDRQKTWKQWATDGGKFIPHPETWLNREGWNDQEPESAGLGTRTFNNLKNAWEFASEA